MNENTDSEKLEKTILEFIKNRTKQNESTAPRHIHRRFDILMEKADQFLSNLSEKKIIKRFYDNEYPENRYTVNE